MIDKHVLVSTSLRIDCPIYHRARARYPPTAGYSAKNLHTTTGLSLFHDARECYRRFNARIALPTHIQTHTRARARIIILRLIIQALCYWRVYRPCKCRAAVINRHCLQRHCARAHIHAHIYTRVRRKFNSKYNRALFLPLSFFFRLARSLAKSINRTSVLTAEPHCEPYTSLRLSARLFILSRGKRAGPGGGADSRFPSPAVYPNVARMDV